MRVVEGLSTAEHATVIRGGAKIVEELRNLKHALNARELAQLLGVTKQHIYKMAAQNLLPSFRLGRTVRFDPREIAEWLQQKKPRTTAHGEFSRMAV